MELLLDTNVLIGLIEKRLGEALSAVLAAPDITLHTSVASLWEIAIKVQLGKLPLRVELEDLPELAEDMTATLLPIKASHVLTLVQPVPATRDPFDRLLLAQCAVEKMKLVTTDRALVSHPLAWRV
jgi:PIN domain nuclease of toxin-antitoxin system